MVWKGLCAMFWRVVVWLFYQWNSKTGIGRPTQDIAVTVFPGWSTWFLVVVEGCTWNSTNVAQFLCPLDKAVRRINSVNIYKRLEFPTKKWKLLSYIFTDFKSLLDAQKHSFVASGVCCCCCFDYLYWVTSKIVFEIYKTSYNKTHSESF